MQGRQGMTLMEIIVVLTIVGITAAITLPNFTLPMEKSYSTTAQNNLLAIYSAEQNYNNNYTSFCSTLITPNPQPSCAEPGNPTCAPDLASINCNLSLNIQDDGTYSYTCSSSTTCTATRNNASNTPVLTLRLDQPIQLQGGVNPSCTVGNKYCP